MTTIITKGTNKKKIQILLQQAKEGKTSLKKIDFNKYCGALSLDSDPILIQTKMRDEWE
ncbi:hypothetical protein [Maribellus mangrovi]|uniref:hypothetical protein n=1 Tax=Maribellus mangrovi TaxID=3133146 RepID=UPI0030EF1E70